MYKGDKSMRKPAQYIITWKKSRESHKNNLKELKKKTENKCFLYLGVLFVYLLHESSYFLLSMSPREKWKMCK